MQTHILKMQNLFENCLFSEWRQYIQSAEIHFIDGPHFFNGEQINPMKIIWIKVLFYKNGTDRSSL